MRRIITEVLPDDLRVGVIAGGHMSTEIGGPRASQASIDREFDAQVTDLTARGDVETLLREMTWERLLQAGNTTYAFLAYLLAVGLADGRPRPPRRPPSSPPPPPCPSGVGTCTERSA